MNLALIHETIAKACPERECRRDGSCISQVCDRMGRLANVLHAHGLGIRRERSRLRNHESGQDHVGIYMLSCPEYLEAMLGSYRVRAAPPFNVNYRYVDEELLYLLVDADCVGLVYQARYIT